MNTHILLVFLHPFIQTLYFAKHKSSHDRVRSVQCSACQAICPPGNGQPAVSARKERTICIPRVAEPVVGVPALRRRMPATSEGRQKKRVSFQWHYRCMQTVRRHISGPEGAERSPGDVEKMRQRVVVPCARHCACARGQHCFKIKPNVTAEVVYSCPLATCVNAGASDTRVPTDDSGSVARMGFCCGLHSNAGSTNTSR